MQGTCDKRFNAVRTALAELLDDADVGASAAVFVDGEPVADLWGGFTDAERTESWQRDTITNVWSTAKTMVALCALILADRGDLDLDAPVATYWPEFTTAGKDGVLGAWHAGRIPLGHPGVSRWRAVAITADWASCSPPTKAWARADSGDSRSHHASVRDKS